MDDMWGGVGQYSHYKEPVYTDIPNYSRAPGDVVTGVVCNQCLAVVQRSNAGAHTNWHDQQRSMSVSTVLWCDAGDHPFKAGRPGSQSVQGTEINEEGVEVSVKQDVCPECAATARKRRVVRELETVKAEECPVCEAVSLVWNKHAGSNQCMACGWDSVTSNQRVQDKTELNRAYGKAASKYKADDQQ